MTVLLLYLHSIHPKLRAKAALQTYLPSLPSPSAIIFFPVSRLEASLDKPKDPELRDCVVRLRDDHGIEHSVRLRATSVYEAALRGLTRLQKVGWESDGSQVRTVVMEIYEEPTTHTVNVKKLLDWLKEPGKSPCDEFRKQKLRPLAK